MNATRGMLGVRGENRNRRRAHGDTKAKPVRRANQAGRPTADELERRKAKVMQVATLMFVTHGYSATSLVDIAKEAGVATRTLYQHFGDKEAIFREVIFAREVGAIVPLPELEEGDTLISVLTKLSYYTCDVALRPRSVELMRLMVAESNRFPELMKKVANATFTRFRRNVARIFERLCDKGLIPPDDHELTGELFVDLILGNTPIMMYTRWSSEPPSEQLLETKIRLFVLGRFGAAVVRSSDKRAIGGRARRKVAATA